MPNSIQRIGVSFETRGASQYSDELRKAAQSNLEYGRSLPTAQMGAYRKALNETTKQISSNVASQNSLSNVLIRTEQQAKRSRLGFTQFRRELRPNEVRRYALEVGRLDHTLGSTNRTLRQTNQRIADRGFSRLGLENVTRTTERQLRDLERTRAALNNAFDSERANNYIRSLEQIEQNIRLISTSSRQLQRFSIPSLNRSGRIDTRRIGREFGFPQTQRPSLREIPGESLRGLNRILGRIERVALSPARDRTARISRNERDLSNINRQIAPLESAVAQARTNLNVIQQGTASALNDLEQQITLYGRLAAEGSADAARRVQELTRQREFIQQNIRIREQELSASERALSVAQARTAIERDRLTLANQQLRAYGIQRSIFQDLANVGLQFGRVLTTNVARGVLRVSNVARGISDRFGEARRRAEAIANVTERLSIPSALNDIIPSERSQPIIQAARDRNLEGIRGATEGRSPTRLENIFGRDTTSFVASLAQTISNLNQPLRRFATALNRFRLPEGVTLDPSRNDVLFRRRVSRRRDASLDIDAPGNRIDYLRRRTSGFNSDTFNADAEGIHPLTRVLLRSLTLGRSGLAAGLSGLAFGREGGAEERRQRATENAVRFRDQLESFQQIEKVLVNNFARIPNLFNDSVIKPLGDFLNRRILSPVRNARDRLRGLRLPEGVSLDPSRNDLLFRRQVSRRRDASLPIDAPDNRIDYLRRVNDNTINPLTRRLLRTLALARTGLQAAGSSFDDRSVSPRRTEDRTRFRDQLRSLLETEFGRRFQDAPRGGLLAPGASLPDDINAQLISAVRGIIANGFRNAISASRQRLTDLFPNTSELVSQFSERLSPALSNVLGLFTRLGTSANNFRKTLVDSAKEGVANVRFLFRGVDSVGKAFVATTGAVTLFLNRVGLIRVSASDILNTFSSIVRGAEVGVVRAGEIVLRTFRSIGTVIGSQISERFNSLITGIGQVAALTARLSIGVDSFGKAIVAASGFVAVIASRLGLTRLAIDNILQGVRLFSLGTRSLGDAWLLINSIFSTLGRDLLNVSLIFGARLLSPVGTFIQLLRQTPSVISTIIPAVAQLGVAITRDLGNALARALSPLTSRLARIFPNTSQLIVELGNNISQSFRNALDTFRQLFEGADTFSRRLVAVAGAFSLVLSRLGIFNRGVRETLTFFVDLIRQINGFRDAAFAIGGVLGAVLTRVIQLGAGILSAIIHPLNTLRQLPNVVSNVIERFRSLFPVLRRIGTAIARDLRLDRLRDGIVNVAQRIRQIDTGRIANGFRRAVEQAKRLRPVLQNLRTAGRNFLDTVERTRLAYGNIQVLTQSFTGSLAATAFTGIRNIGRGIESASLALRTPGGFIDSFRSTEAQIEKIDNRLRQLGRDLAAPQERIRIAQAEFNLIEAKTQASLARIDKRLGEIDSSAKEVEVLQTALERTQAEIRPIDLDIALQEAQLRQLTNPLRRAIDEIETDTNLIPVTLVEQLEAGGQAAETTTFTLKQLREETSRLQKELASLNASGQFETSATEVIRQNLESINEATKEANKEINDLNSDIRAYEDSHKNTLNFLREQKEELSLREAQIKRDIALQEQEESLRVRAFKATRDFLERRRDSAKENLEELQREFNVTRAQIEQERTLLNIRKQRLNVRTETGAGASNTLGAVGDLGRNIQGRVQAQSLTSVGNQLQQVSDNTRAATANFEGLNSAFAQGQVAAAGYGQQLDAADQVIANVDERQRGLLSSIRANVTELAANPVESIFSIVRIGARNVTQLAETVVSRTTSLATTAGGIIGRLILTLTDNIAQIPIRLLGVIPFVGEGVRDVVLSIYTGLRGVVSAAGEIGINLGRGVVGIISSIFGSLYNTAQGIVQNIGDIVENLLRRVIGVGESLFNITRDVVTRIANLYRTAFVGVTDAVTNVFEGAFDIIRNNAVSVFAAIRGIIVDSAQLFVQLVTLPIRTLGRLITEPFELLKDVITSIGSLIKNVILIPISPVIHALSLPIRALGFVLNAFNHNQVPETTKNLKEVQNEGSRTAKIFDGLTNSIEKSFASSTITSKQSLRAYQSVRRESENLTGGLVVGIRSISDVFRIITQGADNLANSVSALHTSFSNLALGAVGFLSIFGGLLAVGKRADTFKGIILAFEQTGVALEDLQEAAGNTVRDIDLMQRTNVALSNTPEEVRQAFSKQFDDLEKSSSKALQAFRENVGDLDGKTGIAAIMEVARAQAIRTGESTDFLFQSLTSGIKRSSPKLIDNTGLVIKIGRANERFAESLGKSVKELTATETQLALLAETIRAGQLSIGEIADETEGARQKFERFSATLSNVLDRLAFGLQPLLEGTLNFFNDVGAQLIPVARDFASAFYATTTVIIEGVKVTFESFQNSVSGFGNTIRTFVSRLAAAIGIDLSSIASESGSFFIDLFVGMASVFGSVAGTIAGIFDIIVNTIRNALETIGSMLIGASPPPEGPLKDIDKGAAAVFLAWQEGFIGVGTRDIELYAQQLADIVGSAFDFGIPRPEDILANTFEQAEQRFGDLSTEDIEKRLKALNDAIEPFEKRLEIIREHFDAIQASAQFSLDAINRQIDGLLQEVIDGNEAAAAQVRRLDALHGRITRGVRLEQDRLDQAALSIQLARAQTAEERVLLEILLAKRKAEEDANKERTKATKAAKEEEGEAVREPDEPLIAEQLPLGETFGTFLNPGLQDVIDQGNAAFRDAFDAARANVLGVPDVDTSDPFGGISPDNFARQQQGNVFERFFDDAAETIRGGPEAIEQAFRDAIADIRETIANVDEDLAVKFDVLIEFGTVTLPTFIASLIDLAAGAIGLNTFLSRHSERFTEAGAIDFSGDGSISLGELAVSFPRIVFQFASNFATNWTEYVKDVRARVRALASPTSPGAPGAGLSFGDRLVGIAFNEDFSINFTGAVNFIWDYLTSDATGAAGVSLRGDIAIFWNDGQVVIDAINSVLGLAGDVAGGVVDVARDITFSVAGLAFSILRLIWTSGEGEKVEDKATAESILGSLANTVIRSALGALGFPFLLGAYFVSTPLDAISIGGAIEFVLGLGADEITAITAEINEFLNVTLPAQLNETFGEGNIFTGLLSVGNTLRNIVHESLFGENLFGDVGSALTAPAIELPEFSISGLFESVSGSINDATFNPGGFGTTSFDTQVNAGLKAVEDFREGYATEVDLLTEEGLKQQRNLDTSRAVRPGGLAGQIIRAIERIPLQVRAFFARNPNFLNLHSILVAAGLLDQGTTLVDVFDTILDNFNQFTEDPIGYVASKLDDAFSGFRDGIEAWANDEDNIIVSAINSLGATLTGNESFNVGDIVDNIFTVFDDVGLAIRTAFNQRTTDDFIAEGFDPGYADTLATGQNANSIGQAILEGFTSLWENAVTYITDPANASQFSLVDSFLQFISGNADLSLSGIVTEIDRVLSEGFSGEGEFSEQQKSFLDALSIGITGVPFDQQSDLIAGFFDGLTGRITGYFTEGSQYYVEPESRGLDTFLQAVFDDPTLQPEDIVPNIIETVGRIPQAIIDALATTDDFGIDVPIVIDGVDVNTVGTGAVSGQTAIAFERQFNLAPLFERILEGVSNSAVTFFDDHPIGDAITGGFRWFSGIEGFTAEGFRDGLADFFEADADERGDLILSFLQNNPDLFGIDSLVQFFTGDEGFTLAGSFESALNNAGGIYSGFGGAIQRIIDGLTGDIRIEDQLSASVAAGTVIGNTGNIFQRIIDDLANGIRDGIRSAIDFFDERNSAGGDFLGLSTFIDSLFQGEFDSVSDFLGSLLTDEEGQSFEDRLQIDNFPDLISAITTGIANLFNSAEAVETGETGNPFDHLFDPTLDGSLAWSLNPENNGIAKGINGVIEAISLLPGIITDIIGFIDTLEEALFNLQSNFSAFLGAPSDEAIFKFRSRFAFETFAETGDDTALNDLLLDFPDFSLSNPIVQHEIERVEEDSAAIANAIVAAQAIDFSQYLTETNLDEFIGNPREAIFSISRDALLLADSDVAALLLSLQTAYTTFGDDASSIISEALEKASQVDFAAEGISPERAAANLVDNYISEEVIRRAEEEFNPRFLRVDESFTAAFQAYQARRSRTLNDLLAQNLYGQVLDSEGFSLEDPLVVQALARRNLTVTDFANRVLSEQAGTFITALREGRNIDQLEFADTLRRLEPIWQFSDSEEKDFLLEGARLYGGLGQDIREIIYNSYIEELRGGRTDAQFFEEEGFLPPAFADLTLDQYKEFFPIGNIQSVQVAAQEVVAENNEQITEAYEAEVEVAVPILGQRLLEIDQAFNAAIEQQNRERSSTLDAALLQPHRYVDAFNISGFSLDDPLVRQALERNRVSVTSFANNVLYEQTAAFSAAIEKGQPIDEIEFVNTLDRYAELFQFSDREENEILLITALQYGGLSDRLQQVVANSFPSSALPDDIQGESFVATDTAADYVDAFLPPPPTLDEVIAQIKLLTDPIAEIINTELDKALRNFGVTEVEGAEGVSGGELVEAMIDNLQLSAENFMGLGDIAGISFRDAFAAGINAGLTVDDIAALIATIKGASPPAEGPLSNLAIWGEAAGTAYRDAFILGINKPIESSDIPEFISTIEAFSPPQSGPLSDVENWGIATGEAWIAGFVSSFDGDVIEDAIFQQSAENPLEGTGLIGFGDLGLRLAEEIADETAEALPEAMGAAVADAEGAITQEVDVSELLSVENLSQLGTDAGMAYREALLTEIAKPLEEAALSGLVSTLSPEDGESGAPTGGPLANIGTWGRAVAATWIEGFSTPFNEYFGTPATGDGDEGDAQGQANQALEGEDAGADDSGPVGAWAATLNHAYQASVSFAELLPQAFSTIAQDLWTVFGKPTIDIFNTLIDGFNQMLQQMGRLQNQAEGLGLLIEPVDLSGLSAGRVSVSAPNFPQAATGGTFGPGGIIVGEEGPELIVPSRRITVFPAQQTSQLLQLETLLQGSHQQPIYNTNTTNYNNRISNDDNSTNIRVDARGRRDARGIAMKIQASKIRGF